MGLAAARMFAAEGARVSVIDIQEEAGQAFVDEIESAVDEFFEDNEIDMLSVAPGDFRTSIVNALNSGEQRNV